MLRNRMRPFPSNPSKRMVVAQLTGLIWAVVLSSIFLLGACGSEEDTVATSPPDDEAAAKAEVAWPESVSESEKTGEDPPRIVFLGDSLTAGLSLEESQAFPHQIGGLLTEAGLEVEIVNAGVSGDTSAGGLARLSWILRQKPDLLVVELGGNDGLRGLDLDATEENLRRIVVQAKEAGSRILLLSMMIPPNYGEEYSFRFAALFPRLAEELNVSITPFLLDGVAGRPELHLPDGLHPNAEGHRIIAEKILPYMKPIVELMILEAGARPTTEAAVGERDA